MGAGLRQSPKYCCPMLGQCTAPALQATHCESRFEAKLRWRTDDERQSVAWKLHRLVQQTRRGGKSHDSAEKASQAIWTQAETCPSKWVGATENPSTRRMGRPLSPLLVVATCAQHFP